MDRVPEALRLAQNSPEGGVDVVALEGGDPHALFRALALETTRTGFVPLLAACDSPDALPHHLRHRHVVIVCEGREGRGAAARWVRLLAQTSPRRHLVVTWDARECGPAAHAADLAAADEVAARIDRADRWRSRGRVRSAECWLSAAAGAARRRGDEASAATVELRLLAALLDHDRSEAAERRARRFLLPATGWDRYAAAGALLADALIAQERFGDARAWVTSLTAEAVLRSEAVPDPVEARVAELDFWQARHLSNHAQATACASADASGWHALRAWTCRDLARVVVITARLESEAFAGPYRMYWLRLLHVLMAGASPPEEVARRVHALVDAGVRSEEVASRRRRRLAAAVAARALLGQPDPQHRIDAVGLLDAVRGPGPEGHLCARLRATGLNARPCSTSGRARPRIAAPPGVERLCSESRHMHLLDGLTSLLAVIEEADDEVGVLAGGCKWICRQTEASAVAIVSADGATLVAAEGWRRPDLAGEIGEILRGAASDVRLPEHDRAAPSFGVSVRYGGVTTGYVVVRGLASARPALQQAAQALAALCGSALRARLDALTAVQRARQSIPEIVGDSPLIAGLREVVVRAASAPFPVLIEGESGTGKELVARALHRLGPRRDHRLSAVNCAALSDELVEAELFGHTRGAFTGAVGARTGLFEEANGGTLFLDEVTELSPRAQAKLLRALQEREIRRVGENQSRVIDVRVVTACNMPMAEAVARGRFRDDLRFRLAVIRVSVPPLRERLEDVPALALAFWRRAATEAGTRALLGPDAVTRLARHTWPGNVRELQNVIAGLVVAAPSRGRVGARHVEQVLSHVTAAGGDPPGVRLEAARRTLERRLISAALVRHAGRRGAAATELGLSRQGLTKALRRLGLAVDEDAAGVA